MVVRGKIGKICNAWQVICWWSLSYCIYRCYIISTTSLWVLFLSILMGVAKISINTFKVLHKMLMMMSSLSCWLHHYDADIIIVTSRKNTKVLDYLVKHGTYRWTVWSIGVYCTTRFSVKNIPNISIHSTVSFVPKLHEQQ